MYILYNSIIHHSQSRVSHDAESVKMLSPKEALLIPVVAHMCSKCSKCTTCLSEIYPGHPVPSGDSGQCSKLFYIKSGQIRSNQIRFVQNANYICRKLPNVFLSNCHFQRYFSYVSATFLPHFCYIFCYISGYISFSSYVPSIVSSFSSKYTPYCGSTQKMGHTLLGNV